MNFTDDELATEEWQLIPDYAGRYSVSNLGRVRRNKTGRILLDCNVKGYRQVGLSMGGLARNYRVHCLVASAFIGTCPLGKEVNHKDLNKSNNRSRNLEYMTHQENKIHFHEATGTRRTPRLLPPQSEKERASHLVIIGRIGGLSRSKTKIETARANGAMSKGAPKGNQNARGARRVRECPVCGWKGKKRVKGCCRKCGAVVN